MRGARLLDGVVGDRAKMRRVDHERLVGELLERDGVDRGEPVRPGQHGDQGVAADDLDAQGALANGRAEHAEIEAAVQQAGDLGRCEQLAAQVEHHAGQRAAQRGREPGQQRVRRRPGEADGEASELAAIRPHVFRALDMPHIAAAEGESFLAHVAAQNSVVA